MFNLIIKVKEMKQIIFFLISVCILILPEYAAAEILIIANKSVTESSVSKLDVQMIFLGKKKSWDSGDKINPVMLKSGETHEKFVNTYVQKTVESFASFWKHAILSGTGVPPKSFSSEEDLVKYVAGKENAVGYISSGTPYQDSGVKMLEIK